MPVATTLRLVAVLLFAAGEIAPAQAPTAALYEDGDAYQVYAAVLPTVDAMRKLSKPLIIQSETHTLTPLSDSCIPSAENRDVVDAALKNYREVNRTPSLLRASKLKLARWYTLLPQEELRQFHPDTPYFVLSAVGFNPSHTVAVVYVAFRCGNQCGSGQSYAAEKKNGQWQLMKDTWSECGWMS